MLPARSTTAKWVVSEDSLGAGSPSRTSALVEARRSSIVDARFAM